MRSLTFWFTVFCTSSYGASEQHLSDHLDAARYICVYDPPFLDSQESNLDCIHISFCSNLSSPPKRKQSISSSNSVLVLHFGASDLFDMQHNLGRSYEGVLS